jgi:CheY-like chemotaxis protein
MESGSIVTDSRSAAEQGRPFKPPCLSFDIAMHGMDGNEFAREIRSKSPVC